MQGMRFAVSTHTAGTLAANHSGEFTLPCAASLVEVSFCNSAASDATLDVGTSADANGIIAAGDVGDSGTPEVFEPSDFNGALANAADAYHMANNTVFSWDIDYDGSSGTAAADMTLVFWFTEG